MAGSKQLTGSHLQKALAMLKDLASLLHTHQIHYSLDAGTLLGIMRENRLLPWDTDMDLAVPASDWPKLKKLRRKIHQAGYITRIRKTNQDIGPILKGSPRLLRIYTRRLGFFKDEQLMDIFIKYRQGNEYLWTVDSRKPILQACDSRFLDELTPHCFEGHSYCIPKDFDAYLTHHYGDWRKVRKDWNWRLEDGCNTNTKDRR